MYLLVNEFYNLVKFCTCSMRFYFMHVHVAQIFIWQIVLYEYLFSGVSLFRILMYWVALCELWCSVESSKNRGGDAFSVPPASKEKWGLCFSEPWPVKSKSKSKTKHNAWEWISKLTAAVKQEWSPACGHKGRIPKRPDPIYRWFKIFTCMYQFCTHFHKKIIEYQCCPGNLIKHLT